MEKKVNGEEGKGNYGIPEIVLYCNNMMNSALPAVFS